jgi:hypothetical protein
MALAAPTRRSASGAAAAPPAAPPEPKKRPRDRPRPGGKARSAATAPATPKKGKTDSPIRKTKGARATKPSASVRAAATAPARKSPTRKTAPKRRTGARVIPIAAGAAVAVTQLPESGLIHRLTRGRAWIGVLGVLLVGIVALNVVTLSFAASAGKIGERNAELSKENSVLQSRAAKVSGQGKMLHEAAKLGLAQQTKAVPQLLNADKGDVAEAAARLAVIAGPVAASSAAGEEGASGTAEAGASGEEATGGEGAAVGESASTETEAANGGDLSAEELAAAEAEGISPEQAALNKEYEETLAAEATG